MTVNVSNIRIKDFFLTNFDSNGMRIGFRKTVTKQRTLQSIIVVSKENYKIKLYIKIQIKIKELTKKEIYFLETIKF